MIVVSLFVIRVFKIVYDSWVNGREKLKGMNWNEIK